MGSVYTFYSFKGGVGRSMALANVAALLSKAGKRVLVVDWDLEAPGLEKYFLDENPSLAAERRKKPGVVDFVKAFADGSPIGWRDCILKAEPFRHGTPVDIISAGRDSGEYVKTLQSLDWSELYGSLGFGAYLEDVREEWVNEYEFVFVDSRTGYSDIGGICTIHLPDVLLLFFTANTQSLRGVIDVAERSQAQRGSLPYDRMPRLVSIPVPSRFEYYTQNAEAREWLRIFARELAPMFGGWLPQDVSPGDVLEKLFVPNIPFWSFGENLPVEQEGTSNPKSIGASYDFLSRLLMNGLDWKKVLGEGPEDDSEERAPEQVDREAEAVYDGLSEQREVRRVLMSLVLAAPHGMGQDAKRRAPLAEFGEASRRVIKQLVEARLLAELPDEVSGEDAVEIARDDTLRHWERLKQWLDEDRKFLLWRQQVRARADDWERNGGEPTYLLSGEALRTAKGFAASRRPDLTGDDINYIEQSLTEERRRRLKYAVAAAFVLLVLSAGAYGLYDYYQQQGVNEAKKSPHELAVEATSRGKLLAANKDYDGALANYSLAIDADPKYDEAYFRRGEARITIANSNLGNISSDERSRQKDLASADFTQAANLTNDAEMKQQALLFAEQAMNAPTPIETPTPAATPTPGVTVDNPHIYIQYSSQSDDSLARTCGLIFSAVGFTVPKPLQVSKVPPVTEVRYYRKSDADDARQIANYLGKCQVQGAQPVYLVGYENSTAIRSGHFEVWLSADAAPRPQNK